MLPTALVDPDSKCHSQRQSTYQLVYRHYTYFSRFFDSFIPCSFYEPKNIFSANRLDPQAASPISPGRTGKYLKFP